MTLSLKIPIANHNWATADLCRHSGDSQPAGLIQAEQHVHHADLDPSHSHANLESCMLVMPTCVSQVL